MERPMSPSKPVEAKEPVSPLESCSSQETITESENKHVEPPSNPAEHDQKNTGITHVDGQVHYKWPLGEQKYVAPEPGIKLSRHYGALWIALFYAALAILSWAFTCILTYRPLYTSSYMNLARGTGWHPTTTRERNLISYRASQVLDSIVSVLTLPVATAVCVKAAVTYTQKQQHRVNARKAMVLADRGWTSVSTMWKSCLKGWRKKNGTKFLVIASLLTVLGFALAPVKQILVTQKTIKTPSVNSIKTVQQLTSWTELFWMNLGAFQAQQLVGALRGKLMSTGLRETLPNIWIRSLKNDCRRGNGCAPTNGQFSLFTLRYTRFPFMAQLPIFYNTGLLRQYAPRLNSTVQGSYLENLSLPEECGHSQWNFYQQYAATEDQASLELCMPGNLTFSPWSPSRDRQDINETLFLRITQAHGNVTVMRLDASTTFGFFELPNIMNDNMVGPILDTVPKLGSWIENPRSGQINSFVIEHESPWPQPVHPGIPLDNIANRGPLLSSVLALFGDGSPLGINSRISAQTTRNSALSCEEWTLPIIGDFYLGSNGCNMWGSVKGWVHWFEQNKADFTAVFFEQALFLANEVMFTHSLSYGASALEVNADYGLDSVIPVMSLASMITISALLALFLTGLFGMAIYSCTSAHWTGALDSFAIMRIGADAGDKLKYRFGQPLKDIDALDDIPCWVGDAVPEAPMGEISIGAEAPLRRKRTYTISKSSSNCS